MTAPATPAEIEPRSTLIKRISSAQTPTHTRDMLTPHPLHSQMVYQGTTPLQHPRPASRGVRTMTSTKLLRWREIRIEILSRGSGHTSPWYRPPLR